MDGGQKDVKPACSAELVNDRLGQRSGFDHRRDAHDSDSHP